MHEIVTIQIGSQSNFLGTHFWNAQESYFTYGGEDESPIDHDVHFRPGIAADGSDTFTPRTLIYDHRSSFGTLRQTNALYEIIAEQNQPLAQSLWQRGTTVQRQQAVEQHPYQRALDAGLEPSSLTKETVRFWSDFNRVYYHPRSLMRLDDPIVTQGSQLSPWEKHSTGLEVFESLDKEHDLIDRDLRFFVEEADHLQGLSIIAGVDDAWGGFASAYAERIEDEYGRVSRWIWGLEDVKGVDERRVAQTKQINAIRSLLSMKDSGSIYLPLANACSSAPPSYLTYDPASQWHTSALQMAALESTTLPSRLRVNNPAHATMSDLESVFVTENPNRTILNLSFSASDPSSGSTTEIINGPANGAELMDLDEPAEPDPLDITLSPTTQNSGQPTSAQSKHTFSHIDVLRGCWNLPRHDPFSPSTFTVRTYETTHLFPLPSSYPQIFRFSSHAGEEGLAIHARVASMSGVAEWLQQSARVVGRTVDVGEREEMYSELRRMAEEYVEGLDGGSDSGSDD